MGVVSRDGWAVVDDLRGGRFDGAAAHGGWDWATPIEQGQGQGQGQGRPGGAAEVAEDARCGDWTAAGECSRNAAFMQSTCKAACARLAARAAALGAGSEACDLSNPGPNPNPNPNPHPNPNPSPSPNP